MCPIYPLSDGMTCGSANRPRAISEQPVTWATRQYVMKKRGVFKTTVSRLQSAELKPEDVAEIEFNFEALKPYLRA